MGQNDWIFFTKVKKEKDEKMFDSKAKQIKTRQSAKRRKKSLEENPVCNE